MQTSINSRQIASQSVVNEIDAVLSEDSLSTCSQSSEEIIDEELRKKIIAEKAYYLAEARGFAGGCDLDDWLVAEAEVNQLLGGSCITA